MASCIFAQKDSSVCNWNNQIKANPFKIFAFVNPGFELGYERRIYKRFAVEADVAYLTKVLSLAPYRQYSGKRLIMEGKYYFDLRDPVYQPYVSVCAIYNTMDIIAVVQLNRKSGYNKEEVRLIKDSRSLNVNAGIKVLDKRLCFDIVAGLGVKMKHTVCEGKSDPSSRTVGYPNRFTIALAEGDSMNPNVVLSIRVGFRF